MYRNWFDNFIYLDETGAEEDDLPVFQYLQGDVDYSGIEGELSVPIIDSGPFKLIADLRRRSAIEAEIGHMKTDGRLSRCPLKGTIGDALFAALCACGHNIRKILAHLRTWLAWIVTALWTAENELQRRHHTIVAARALCSR